eukprot:s597_g21.t1
MWGMGPKALKSGILLCLRSLIRPRQIQHMVDVKCPQFRRLKWGWGDLWSSWPMQRSGHEAVVGEAEQSAAIFFCNAFADENIDLLELPLNHMTWKAIVISTDGRRIGLKPEMK